MHDHYPGLVLGYHGCDRAIAERVFASGGELKRSENAYDWLGHGIYFWENNAQRALDWARWLAQHPRAGGPVVTEPAVVGAVLDLGLCLNLLDGRFLALLPTAYQQLVNTCQSVAQPLPTNRPLRKSHDLLLRDLDCAVIETLHQSRTDRSQPIFDSVRGVFVEGAPVYPGAAIRSLNHIQICVRNSACIQGYFRPR